MAGVAGGVSTLRIVGFFANRHRAMFFWLGGLGLLVGILEGINLGAFVPVLYALLDSDPAQISSQSQRGLIEGARVVLAHVPVADPFLAACALLGALTLFKALLSLVHEYLTANITGRLLHRYRKEMIARLAQRPLVHFEESRAGALVYDLIQPPIMLARLLYLLPRLMIDLLRAVFVAVLLIYVEPTFALGLAALAAVVYLAFSKKVSVYLYQLGLKRRGAEQEMTSMATEWLQGVRPIRIAGADRHWLDSFDRASRRAQSAYVRSFFLLSSPRHIFELAGFLLLVAGLMLVYRMDPAGFKGHVVTFGIFAVGLVRILPSLASLARGPLEIRNTIPDIVRIYEAVQQEPPADSSGGSTYRPFRRALRLEGVQVIYPSGVRALDGVALEIPKGTAIALVGPSGCGKTTLLNTMIGVQRASAGRIAFDDDEIGALDLRSLLDHVGYVGQKVTLFHGTIRQNIAFFRSDAPLERVTAVAKLAKIDEFIHTLPAGYESQVGEGGANLSGGQAQRIAIARALYNDPDLLALDEPTSALDSSSEGYVLESIQQASRDRTVILVTHRLSSVRWADRIYVLNAGRIVQQGSWEELVAAEGMFRNMCREQGLIP